MDLHLHRVHFLVYFHFVTDMQQIFQNLKFVHNSRRIVATAVRETLAVLSTVLRANPLQNNEFALNMGGPRDILPMLYGCLTRPYNTVVLTRF